MKVLLAYSPVDGGEAAARLVSLLASLDVGVVDVTSTGVAPDVDAVLALLTPAALGDRTVLGSLQHSRAQGRSALPLSAATPGAFPTPGDLARVVEWLNTPAQPPASRYHVVSAVNSVIGEGNLVVNVTGGAGWSTAETAQLVAALRLQTGSAPMNTDELRSLFAGVQTQIQQVETLLSHGFTATLARFEVNEQRIVGPIMARLDAQHTAEMAAMIDVFDAVAISADDLTRLLAAVRCSLGEVKEKRSHLADDKFVASADQLSEMIDAPALDVKHKLKLTLPIIPFLLDYEGEIELNSRLNLERAWGAFRQLLHGSPGRIA